MKQKISLLYQSFYLTKRAYLAFSIVVGCFAMSFFFNAMFVIAQLLLLFVCCSIVVDVLLLYAKRKALLAGRICKERFSNGDKNLVQLQFYNNYAFSIALKIIDELPFQFQERNWQQLLNVEKFEKKMLQYELRPVQRGEYLFGKIQAFVTSPMQMVQRRFSFPAQQTVFVYPSYLQMKKYSLHAIGNRLNETGTKKMRKLGSSVEFEQIKDYVRGDDYRTINWKATARKNQVMVNTYVDEKSQQVYCLIDKSRNMRMPFNGMHLLDYAVNASLVVSNVALNKQDKVGLISFANQLNTFIPACRNNIQMQAILDALYKEQTHFLDADYEGLYAHIRYKVKQRSLLILFTNFESQYALERQLPYLKKIAHHHLLMVVIFENTELKKVVHTKAENTEEVYMQVIAEKFSYEKRLIVKELQKAGILTLLTTPELLTIDAVNKYIEVKTRQAI